MKKYKIVLLFLANLFQSLFSLLADESASAWLNRMAQNLALNSDFQAQLEVGLLKSEPGLLAKSKGQLPLNTVVFHFLRQKDNKSFILLTAKPSLLSGISFLKRQRQLVAYNPHCLCWQDINEILFFQRTGFYSFELNLLNLLNFKHIEEKVTLINDTKSSQNFVAILLYPLDPLPEVKSLRLLLRETDALPLSLEYLSDEGVALRQVTYLSFYQWEEAYWPQTIVIYSLASPSLVLTIQNPNFNTLPEFVFSKSFIEEIAY